MYAVYELKIRSIAFEKSQTTYHNSKELMDKYIAYFCKQIKVISFDIIEVSKELMELVSQEGSITLEQLNEIQSKRYSYLVGTLMNKELLGLPIIYAGELKAPNIFLAVKSYYSPSKEGEEAYLSYTPFDIEPITLNLGGLLNKAYNRIFCPFSDFEYMIDYCKNDWDTRIAFQQARGNIFDKLNPWVFPLTTK